MESGPILKLLRSRAAPDLPFSAPPSQMLASLLAAALLLSSASAQAPYCFDLTLQLCLGWSIASGNITFTAQCSPSAAALNWCAFGVSLDGSGSMVPASVMMLSVDTATVYVEDRQITDYVAPACFPAQRSTLLSSSISAKGVLSASWTRPLAVPDAGQFNVTNSFISMIAASASSAAASASPLCRTVGMKEHDLHVARIPINLMLPPPEGRRL